MDVNLKEMDPIALKKGLEAGELIAIDVREPLEYHEEHISRAQLYPLSQFDAKQLPDPVGKKLVFYCQMGRRSSIAATKWADQVGANEVFYLKGGLNSWKRLNLSTVIDSAASTKVEKQTYVLSGLIILIALLLAVFISEWFLVIPAAIAILLIISGAMGHSYLSFLLSKLPWNR